MPRAGTSTEVDNTANREDAVPERMRYVHISRAADARMTNLAQDPLAVYLTDVPGKKDSWMNRAALRAAASYTWWRAVEHNVAWTIHGDSFIEFHSTHDDKERLKTPVDRVMDSLTPWFTGMFLQHETTKRFAELKSKSDAAISASLGDEMHNMVYIDNLTTLREARGRGYASALVRMVNALADAEGRGTWLVSSNVANEGFYNSLGFVTVERFTVGEDNPTWDRPPVPVDIMARKPCTVGVVDDAAASSG